MTEMSSTSGHGRPPESAGLSARSPLTLTEEHRLLLQQVTVSAEKLLTATDRDRWPAAELAALAECARAEVLRQVSDEEALLFPAAPAQTVAGLARDHVRLRAAAELLARAARRGTAYVPRPARRRRPRLRHPARTAPAQRGRPARVRPRAAGRAEPAAAQENLPGRDGQRLRSRLCQSGWLPAAWLVSRRPGGRCSGNGTRAVTTSGRCRSAAVRTRSR